MWPKNTISHRKYWRLLDVAAASDSRRESEDVSPVRMVQKLLDKAISTQASDLHFEPSSTGITVRFRQDGILRVTEEIPESIRAEVLSRIKIMASLDIAEKRRPQDGRIKVVHMGKAVDLRASTLPTEYGEKIVLRILDQTAVDLDVDRLGFDQDGLDLFRRTIGLPYGMILITGPTGSGKTTTLYSAIQRVKSPEVNITTVEDPIEYRIPGIIQTAVKADIGLTFASALRTILRQDPNIIMVGEMRDQETAQISIRAALTGHMVFSTLHTNDAPSAITRLIDMGIEPFLVSSAINLVVAQRLVRRICPHCAGPDHKASARLALLEESNTEGEWLHGEGCAHCNHSGYKGRLGVFEMMPISESIRSQIARSPDANQIRRIALSGGLRPLRVDAIEKARRGITSLEEVIRETSH